jgi:outer membrane receptor protein involved in Fe transport
MTRRLLLSLVAVLISVFLALPAPASTTGSIRGRVVDSTTNAPIAGAKVTAESPSQSATTLTDSTGSFSFLALSPDSYTIRVEKTGYETAAQAGAVVFADQSSSYVISLASALRTIAHVASRSSGSLVRPGTTSDVYSINAAGQKATQSVAGSGSLNQAYGAIASVPGVSMPSGQQGWYQAVYIRGGDYDQVAYEFDGVPVVRQSDFAPIVTLSALGQQEVQVYTGGTPATSNSTGLAGYINQVIKTGTSPGYANAEGSIGAPQFYHLASAEAGGSTPDRLFSYYVGLAGADQGYRYIDQFNGVGDPRYFYPLSVRSENQVYFVVDGSCLLVAPHCKNDPNFGAKFSPGNSYFQANGADRENVMNFHIGIPHKDGAGKDDIQLLYVTGNIETQFYSSLNDVYSNGVWPDGIPYLDSTYYNGRLGQAPVPSQLVNAPFPSSPGGRILNNTTVGGTTTTPSLVGANQRDGNNVGFSVEKAQYQRNFDNHSYLRLLAYGEYSDWLINGPDGAQLDFAADPAEYDVLANIYGANAIYSNQLSSKNLFTASLAYTLQTLSNYNAEFASVAGNTVPASGLGTVISSYVGNNGNCYNYRTGAQWSCFDKGSQGGIVTSQKPGCPAPANFPAMCLTPGTALLGTPAALAGAHWVMTEDGRSAQVDTVAPYFTSLALADVWTPNDRLLINLGARMDEFQYHLNNTAAGYPARAFWFNAFNNENCGAPATNPISRWNESTDTFGSCPAGYQPLTTPGVGLVNSVPSSVTYWEFSPRVGLTYTLNTNTVLRASLGKYVRAPATSAQEVNAVQQDLPDEISPFYKLGYLTPYHPNEPDTSSNYDFSWEQRIKGTNLSFKLSPFYRSTRNQVQYFATDPATGVGTGLNVGTQQSSGVEFSFQGGDFSKDGLSFQLSYTYTSSKIKYSTTANNVSVLDSFNSAIEQYNSYTKACAGSAANSTMCGGGVYAGNAVPVFHNGGATVDNPYYASAPEALIDRNGWFTTYDFIPTAFNNANGFAVPDVATLVVNYKHSRFSVTPNLTYTSGSSYGSPLSWPGYVPQSCYQSPALTPSAPGASCNGTYTTASGSTAAPGVVFIPDPYTHRFDGLGSLLQPWQLTLNLAASYDINPRLSLTMTASNLFNACFQRGYAWDDSNICMYSNLPSNILAPAGNFLTTPPVQLKYPYGPWSNQNEVGYTAVKQPFQMTFDLHIRL